MNINKYVKQFLNELYFQINKYYDISKLTDQDKQIIDSILGAEYGHLFYLYYPPKSKVRYNPELATNFNIFILDIFVECIRIVFLCDVQIEPDKKQSVFNDLIKFVRTYISKADNHDNLITSEILLKIKKDLRKEFKKIYNDVPIDRNDNRNLYLYLNNKYSDISLYSLKSYYEKISTEINKIFPRNIFYIFLMALIFSLTSIILYKENSLFFILVIILFGILLLVYCINTFKKIDNKLQLLNNQNSIFMTYERFGIDVIRLEVSPELVCYADNESLNTIMPIIADLRLELTDKHGFVLPSVRIIDNQNIKNGIKIFIRNDEVDFFEMDYSIVDFPVEKFKNKLKDIVLSNIDKVFTIQEAAMIMELNVLVNGRKDILENKLDIYDIREIMVKIIQKGGSLIDFLYTYERINHHLKTTKNTDELAELVYLDIKKEA